MYNDWANTKSSQFSFVLPSSAWLNLITDIFLSEQNTCGFGRACAKACPPGIVLPSSNKWHFRDITNFNLTCILVNMTVCARAVVSVQVSSELHAYTRPNVHQRSFFETKELEKWKCLRPKLYARLLMTNGHKRKVNGLQFKEYQLDLLQVKQNRLDIIQIS